MNRTSVRECVSVLAELNCSYASMLHASEFFTCKTLELDVYIQIIFKVIIIIINNPIKIWK